MTVRTTLGRFQIIVNAMHDRFDELGMISDLICKFRGRPKIAVDTANDLLDSRHVAIDVVGDLLDNIDITVNIVDHLLDRHDVIIDIVRHFQVSRRHH